MTGESLEVRPTDETEIDHLAKVWFDGWPDAHELIVPAELTRRRTLARFRDRLRAFGVRRSAFGVLVLVLGSGF
jgi:hypothetical protein